MKTVKRVYEDEIKKLFELPFFDFCICLHLSYDLTRECRDRRTEVVMSHKTGSLKDYENHIHYGVNFYEENLFSES